MNALNYKMGKSLLFIFLITTTLCSVSQSLKRQALSSLGGTSEYNGFYIRQTTGQASNTSLFKSNTNTLRQGFQQVPAAKSATKNNPCSLVVFPNPGSDDITIKTGIAHASYNLQVLDIQGRALLNENHITTENHIIKLSALPNAIYLLKVQLDNGNTCVSKINIAHE